MFSYTSSGIETVNTKFIYFHMLLAIQVSCACRLHLRWPPGYQPYPHHTVELFAIGIYSCLVTLVVGIVDKQ